MHVFFGIVKDSRGHSDSLRHLVSLFVVWWSCHFLLGMHHFWIPQTTLARGGWRVDPLILLLSCCTCLGVQSAISIHGKFMRKKRQVGNALNKHCKRINAPPLQTVNDSNVLIDVRIITNENSPGNRRKKWFCSRIAAKPPKPWKSATPRTFVSSPPRWC